ncbi:MAG: histidine phosphatase family protein, partial [Pseudomonadota bacterium]|nr:histidine phosphatase family protein [Pseudomonadota bacterium]
MSATLLLLRHGQIKANRQRRWHGSTDSALTLKGRIQATLTSRALRKRGDIQAVYTSPLQRCRHTGALAGSHMTHQSTVIDGLAEMSIGDWEGKKFT